MTAIPTAIDADTMEATTDLRVAFFSDSLPERNGTGAYYHDLRDHLAPRVGAVDVIQPSPRRGWTGLSLPLPGDPTQKLVLPDPFRIQRAMARLRPHVVVGVTPGPFGLSGLWMARRHGCAYISAYHTNFEALADLYWGNMKGRLITGTLGTINRFICRRSATVLVNNSGLVDTVRSLGTQRVDVMGTPLDRSFLAMPPLDPPARLTRICFAGRLAAEKNIESVIAAAAHWPQLHFVIAGDGPMRATVESAAAEQENLEYRGWLGREDLCGLIDESSLLVLPSHVETFGSIALEAMVRGRPVLVSANAGIHDWPQVAGNLYALDPDETLAAAIGRLRLQPSGALQAIGERAREGALQLHRDTMDQWVSVLSTHSTRTA